ncbi:MAG: hypothetical protein IOD12_02080 [Silvanigrellales bacterium]|jgi:hypothetical protein|nr:hypothetical protein [Silvanigrellales bacterium]
MLIRLFTFPALLLLAGACAQKEAGSSSQAFKDRTGQCDTLAPRVVSQCQKCLVPMTAGVCPDGKRHAWLEMFPTEAEFNAAMRIDSICENNPYLATRSSLPSLGQVLVEPSTGRPYQGSADKGFNAPGLNVCADTARLKTEADYRAMTPGTAPTTTTAQVPGAPTTTTTTTVVTTGGTAPQTAQPPQTMPPQTAQPPQTMPGQTSTTTQGTQPAAAPAPVPPVSTIRAFTVGPSPGYTHIKSSFKRQAAELLENEKCKLPAGAKVPVTKYSVRTGSKGHFVATIAAPMCDIPAGSTMYFFADHFSDVPQELLDQVKALW